MRLSTKYRVGQKVFFIGENAEITFGIIDTIEICIKKTTVSTVYHILDREFLSHQLSCSRNGAKQYLKKLINAN